jgi:hypothetical protein
MNAALDIIDHQLQRLAFKMAITGCQLTLILGRLRKTAPATRRGANEQATPLSFPGGSTRPRTRFPMRHGQAVSK